MSIKANLTKGSVNNEGVSFSQMKDEPGIYQRINGDDQQYFIADCDGKVLLYDNDGPCFMMASAKDYPAPFQFALIPFSITITLSNEDF